MRNSFALLIIIGLFIAGCAQSKVATSPETQQQELQKPAESGKGASQPTKETISEKGSAVVASKERSGAAEGVSGMFEDVHFDYDQYTIREDARGVLKKIDDHLLKNGGEKVLMEGHCDERGTTEYNLGLGDRRARATKDFLVSLGVASARVETISYGKEKPLCERQTEDCWARNRRAHAVVLKAARQDH